MTLNLLSDATNQAGHEPCLVIREIHTPDELVGHLRLRHDVYAHYGHLPTNEDGLDIDAWDEASHFLAAYHVDGLDIRMVGGIRLVLPDGQGPMAHVVRGLLRTARSPALRSMKKRSTPLPTEVSHDLSSVLVEPRRLGQMVVEFSRTVRLPSHRGRSFGRSLATAIHGLALNLGATIGVGCCPLNLLSFYESVGCELLRDIPTAPYPEIGKIAMALRVPLLQLPPDLSGQCRDAARALTTGSWCPCGTPCASVTRLMAVEQGFSVARL